MRKSKSADFVWQELRKQVLAMAKAEAMLSSYLHAAVLSQKSLEESLAYLLAEKLATQHMAAISISEVMREAFCSSAEMRAALRSDLLAVADRDPAAQGFAEPFLHYKGFHAIEAYRVAHWLWQRKRRALAFFWQNRIAEVLAVDIHPAAKIGKGLFIDHATGVVVGETAVIGDNVSMLHAVTLGGTGKETGDRHPKVGNGVLIGAGAKILGNVKVGNCSKIGAGSVVLEDVAAHTTVAGVPAKIVGHPSSKNPALIMDQSFGKNG